MQATKLWIGTDYAFGYRRKGGPLPINAERAKILEIIKEPIFNKSRDRTYVRIQRLLDNGLPNPKHPDPVKVGAREILEFWDEYIETVEDEREAYKLREEERQQREAERRAKQQEQDAAYYIGSFLRGCVIRWEREDREKKEREAQEAKLKRVKRINNVLITRGFKPGEFWIIGEQVNIKMDEMERWLGFGEQTS